MLFGEFAGGCLVKDVGRHSWLIGADDAIERQSLASDVGGDAGRGADHVAARNEAEVGLEVFCDDGLCPPCGEQVAGVEVLTVCSESIFVCGC